jgi:hypothetical protein
MNCNFAKKGRKRRRGEARRRNYLLLSLLCFVPSNESDRKRKEIKIAQKLAFLGCAISFYVVDGVKKKTTTTPDDDG